MRSTKLAARGRRGRTEELRSSAGVRLAASVAGPRGRASGAWSGRIEPLLLDPGQGEGQSGRGELDGDVVSPVAGEPAGDVRVDRRRRSLGATGRRGSTWIWTRGEARLGQLGTARGLGPERRHGGYRRAWELMASAMALVGVSWPTEKERESCVRIEREKRNGEKEKGEKREVAAGRGAGPVMRINGGGALASMAGCGLRVEEELGHGLDLGLCGLVGWGIRGSCWRRRME